MKIKILIPVFNDWQSVSKLLEEINNLMISSEFKISVIIINDASNHDRQNEDKTFNNIESVKILNMKREYSSKIDTADFYSLPKIKAI